VKFHENLSSSSRSGTDGQTHDEDIEAYFCKFSLQKNETYSILHRIFRVPAKIVQETRFDEVFYLGLAQPVAPVQHVAPIDTRNEKTSFNPSHGKAEVQRHKIFLSLKLIIYLDTR
jgi:hypothetical protein